MNFFTRPRRDQGGIDTFQKNFKVYTGAYIGKNSLDSGGKIILPASALDDIARLRVVYPLLFEVQSYPSVEGNIKTHCGVLEFSGEEGLAYIPYWMLQHLRLQPGQLVTIKSATLPKGTYVKLRPQTKDFIEISDPKAVLEAKLRQFSCLTKGDTIIIEYNNRHYCIDIMEVSASSGPVNAITIVEADVEVDFDRPADMPPSPQNKPPQMTFPTINNNNNNNSATSSSNATVKTPSQPTTPVPITSTNNNDKAAAAATSTSPAEPSFAAFAGQGRRLDGKVQKESPSPSPTPNTSSSKSAIATSSTNTSTNNSSTQGRLVFGSSTPSNSAAKPTTSSSSSSSSTSSSSAAKPTTSSSSSSSSTSSSSAAKPTTPTPTTTKKEDEKPKSSFVAFGGQGRSLK